MTSPRVWLITGASSGIGRCLAEVLLSKGEIVVATARNPTTLANLQTKYPPTQLLPLKCDVTIKSDITSTFEKALTTFHRVDVVVNNAGLGLISEAETEQEEVAKKVFEVNFWGAARVSKEAVRLFRESNPPGVGGRLLNISSGAGTSGIPGSGYYSASKHGELSTKSLAGEIDPKWNIKISIIELGSFKTRILEPGGMTIVPPHPAYSPELPFFALRNAINAGAFAKGDPYKAAEKLYEFSKLDEPPLHLPLGKETVVGMQAEGKKFAAIVEKYGNWADGLEFD